MRKHYLIFISLLLIGIHPALSQSSWNIQIDAILRDKKAHIGVHILNLKDGVELQVNGEHTFPMQSVFKFPIALAVLDMLQQKQLPLDHGIYVAKKDLLLDTWSPLRDQYPEGNLTLPISKLLAVMVSQSDNNACDILLRWIGGEEVVQRYIQKLGISDMKIVANEEAMHRDWNVQYLNYSSPKSSNELLVKAYKSNLLSPQYLDFFWKVMTETSTGKKRITAPLPKGSIVSHKTGSSGTTSYGLTGAVNDVGVVQLADGTAYAISVFVVNSLEDESTNEQIIAAVSQITYLHLKK
ncbi:class A beta-lactamase, subclass A2 [Sphingobacterium sp. SYP-B4668]|uniref:class A beta-lactamase, subclass A2 n=1 Tax=Sphingobacterium sp. SYP-B4668 TaxID=2996035 RepID=UPI0022DDF2BD|nr:class A beta-lactamase, subclass A2 [Sphingobacterium sp. SYP-B4668]